jgi:hypothetical protein
MSHDILDLPPQRPKRRYYRVLGYIGLGLMLYGMMSRFFHWLFSTESLLAGVLLVVIRNTLVLTNNRPLSPGIVFYYLGYSLLVIGLMGLLLFKQDKLIIARLAIALSVLLFFLQFLAKTKRS